MRSPSLALITCALLVSLSGQAAGPGASQRKSQRQVDALPRLSPLGLRRLRRNMGVIEENIEGAKKNITTCEQNVVIIKGEFAELDKLLAESNELAETYRKYLSDAESERVKNEAAVAKLNGWKKRALASIDTNTPEGKAALSKVDEELRNREVWRVDAGEKRGRMAKLLQELSGSHQKVQARKNALTAEIKLWQKRVFEYQAMIKDLEKSRTLYERVLARSENN